MSEQSIRVKIVFSRKWLLRVLVWCTGRRCRASTDEKCRKTANIIQKILHSNRIERSNRMLRHQKRLQFINVCTKWMAVFMPYDKNFFFCAKLMCSIAIDARPHEDGENDEKSHWWFDIFFFFIRCLIVRGTRWWNVWKMTRDIYCNINFLS